jgi:hypothetical protein
MIPYAPISVITDDITPGLNEPRSTHDGHIEVIEGGMVNKATNYEDPNPHFMLCGSMRVREKKWSFFLKVFFYFILIAVYNGPSLLALIGNVLLIFTFVQNVHDCNTNGTGGRLGQSFGISVDYYSANQCSCVNV